MNDFFLWESLVIWMFLAMVVFFVLQRMGVRSELSVLNIQCVLHRPLFPIMYEVSIRAGTETQRQEDPYGRHEVPNLGGGGFRPFTFEMHGHRRCTKEE